MTPLVLALLVAASPPPPAPRPTTIASQEAGGLKMRLLQRLKDADARDEGVFHDDVTADVAPLFPAGQAFGETERVVRAQALGRLEKFKGEPHEGTTMYVVRFPLEAGSLDDVHVVIDFDFEGAREPDMRLRRVKAFLRASNM